MVSHVNPREPAAGWREPPYHKTIAEVRLEIRRTLAVLFRLNDVVELRAIEGRQVRSGYFDDHDVLAEDAAELDRQGWQLYTSLNEINPALLARAPNKVIDRPEATTTDRDVTRRRYLLLDFDPVRPADVSATEEEKWAAYLKAKEVRKYLRDEGWPDPVIANSGNGFHFLYRVDLPNDRVSRELVRGVLEALAATFDDDRTKIDTAVHNAARLVRLYGTHTRKGSHTLDRPHRRSEILKVPKEA